MACPTNHPRSSRTEKKSFEILKYMGLLGCYKSPSESSDSSSSFPAPAVAIPNSSSIISMTIFNTTSVTLRYYSTAPDDFWPMAPRSLASSISSGLGSGLNPSVSAYSSSSSWTINTAAITVAVLRVAAVE